MPQYGYVFLRKVLATPFYMVLSSGVQCASYIQSSDTFVLCITACILVGSVLFYLIFLPEAHVPENLILKGGRLGDNH